MEKRKSPDLGLNGLLNGNADESENHFFSWLLSVFLLVMLFILGFFSCFGLCAVLQNSMNDTLQHGDRILMYKYPFSLKPGDIVIIEENKNTSVRQPHQRLIKRLIASEGDTVLFEKDSFIGIHPESRYPLYTVKLSVKRKGKQHFITLNEPYIKNQAMHYEEGNYSHNLFNWIDHPIVIPSGQFFVLGDNRDNSLDSRGLGFFYRHEIVGKQFLKLEGRWKPFFMALYNDDGSS